MQKYYLKNIIDRGLFELTKILIAFSITVTLSGLLWYDLSYIKMFLIILLIYISLSVITHNIKFFLISSMSMVTLLVIGFIVALIFNELSNILLTIRQYITVYNEAIINGTLIPTKYQMLPEIMIGIVTCCIIISISRYKYYYLALFTLGLSIFLTAFSINGYYNVIAYFIFIGAIITNYFYYFYTKNIKNKEKHSFYHLAFNAVIFSLILIFLASNLYKSKPRPLLFFYDIGKAVERFIENMNKKAESTDGNGQGNNGAANGNGNAKKEDEEDAVVVGFDSGELLKENVVTSNDAILYVYTAKPTYLRGSVCNIFDGKEWSYNIDHEYEISDLDEHIIGLKWLSENYVNEDSKPSNEKEIKKRYFEEDQVSVIYKNIATKTVFTPINLIAIYDTDGNHSNDIFNFNEGGTLNYHAELTKGFSYSFTYLKPRYGVEDFDKLLRMSNYELYQKFDSEYKDDLVKKANYIEQNYMQLPNSITSRTVKLAKDIMNAYENNYDRAKAIEEYLKTNYDYTYSTVLPEDGEDIIDYFLFETKEGFCTYNASTMVVMLRSIGIPARYVKGFVTRGSMGRDELSADNDKKSKIDTNMNVVTGWDAHAWVEAYLEGFGWVSFEPTSGFQFNQIQEEKYNTQILTEEELKIREVYDLESIAQSQKRIPLAGILIILSIIIFIAILLWIYRRYERTKDNFRLSNTRNKIQMVYKNILLLMEILGYKKEEHQTLREYAKMINGELDTQKHNFIKLTNIFEIAYYSNKKIEDETLEIFDAYYKELKHQAKQKTNFFKVNMALFINKIK